MGVAAGRDVTVDQRTTYQQTIHHQTLPQRFLFSWRLGPSPQQRLARTARELAAAVWAQESAELARLVADTGDARPADVGFREPGLVYWRTDGGQRRGSLAEIRDYYQRLGRGRLVVVGPAGSGKTVLAVQLVRDLAAAHIAAADRGSAPGRGAGGKPVPVPVRLSAPAFDPTAGTDLTDVAAREVAGEVATRLDAWVAEQLGTVYGVRPQQARALVADGWVLPVLDGVDEMDPPGHPPQRATALLAALNQPTAAAAGLRPVVATCRTDRYTHLSTAQDVAGGRPVAQDATVVEVQPLTAAAARQYLIYRFPDPAGSQHGEPRWRPVLDRLDTDRAHDPLVAALRSPLRLFMAVAGYRAPATEPVELTGHRDPAGLDDHLFGMLVPAATARYPRPGGGHYDPEQVTRWLTTLAHHLHTEDLAGRSGTDLLLHELWTAAGRRLPRYLSALILTITAAAGALPILIGIATGPARGDSSTVPWLLLLVGLVAMTAWRSSRPEVDLRRFDLSAVRTARTRRRLAVGLAVALAVAPVVTTVSTATLDGRTTSGLVVTVVLLGLVFGIPFRLVRALEARPQAIDVPRRLVSQGITHTAGMLGLVLVPALAFVIALELRPVLAIGPAIGLVAGLAPVLVIGLALVLAPAPVLARTVMVVVVVGLVVGLVAGFGPGVALIVGIGMATSPWPRYLVACVLLARRHELPHRPAVFFDWAYGAGLMRLAGIAVQFRHREFQNWLTRR